MLYRFLNAFQQDARGVSAVEFALIAPMMITVYFGAVEMSNVLLADRKVTSVASATTDLVAQAVQINDDEIDDIFQATSAIMEPYDPSTVEIVVASINMDIDGNTTVGWSDAFNATALIEGAPYALPAGIAQPGGSIVVTTVRYSYATTIGEFLTNGISVEDTFYQRPRRVMRVLRID